MIESITNKSVMITNGNSIAVPSHLSVNGVSGVTK